jgi:hypothetical protein
VLHPKVMLRRQTQVHRAQTRKAAVVEAGAATLLPIQTAAAFSDPRTAAKPGRS